MKSKSKKYKLNKKITRFFIFILAMPKYESEQNFSFLSIPESGLKAMRVGEERKKERVKVSVNNGQY